MTGEFARAFGLESHGRLAGLWHDLGKYSAEFQARIRAGAGATLESKRAPGRVDHSTYGAQHAHREVGPMGWTIAYCIAGHHAGLADAFRTSSEGTPLTARLDAESIPRVPSQEPGLEAPPSGLLAPDALSADELRGELRSWTTFDRDDQRRAFQLAFLTRFLFSALVDADSLCTERFCDPDAARERSVASVTMADLGARCRKYVDALCRDDSIVQRARGRVLERCRSQAALEPGFFSLTVPTGGGKTLSSLSFALEHAARHNLRRVVYAIPFTSIVEQNVHVLREALECDGERIVLEHHSNLDPDRETSWSHRAAENWDAPVIATTNVRLFESLFAHTRGRCRRLHRLAHSVIVLDEAQSLPVHLLAPCLEALRELVNAYGCSVMLCTATQPAITRTEEFPIGLDGTREIIDDVPALFRDLRRTDVQAIGNRSDDELTEELLRHASFLCVVNTRGHAAALFERLRARRGHGLYHLSAAMCPSHRSEILGSVRECLQEGRPCGLVSTQVVEAGVDVDFPIVYRAMAGMDSIAQAAGRCNREGHRKTGPVRVFETDVRPPPTVAGAARDTREILASTPPDLLAPDLVEEYFRLHYWKRSDFWDANDILRCFRLGRRDETPLLADFRLASSAFKMIDDPQIPILVPYGEGRGLIEELHHAAEPYRGLLRRLQPFTVGVYPRELDLLHERLLVSEPHEGLLTLANNRAYDDALGLRVLDVAGSNPLIV